MRVTPTIFAPGCRLTQVPTRLTSVEARTRKPSEWGGWVALRLAWWQVSLHQLQIVA
jgi:hypothetical protein